jgi:hypothetical protein
MNNDIRLKVTFPTHRKTVKLIHLVGCEGFFSLLQLWCYTAQNHSKGVLDGYDKDDIEIAAMWKGKRGEFLKAAIKVGYVKKIKNGYEIHEWKEHNPYAFHAEERSEKARVAAKKRWEVSGSKGLVDASSIDVALPQASSSNAPSPNPSPLPSPDPTPNKKIVPPEGVCSQVWGDFVKLRNKKKAPVTETALEGIENQAKKAGITLEEALRECCERGWQGFKADWYKEQSKKENSYVGLSKIDYSKGVNDDGTF